VQNQGAKTGDAADLTTYRRAPLAEVEHLIAGARHTARR
jgi:hypothetical protein